MSKPRHQKPHRRYLVSDLGFAYAVHDTLRPQEYAFPTGKGQEHLTTNMYNVERVGIYPTREEAVRVALELNEAHERGARSA